MLEAGVIRFAPSHLKSIGNIEFDGVDHNDHPDYVDAYVSSAEWTNTGAPLSDAELDELNSGRYSDFIHDKLQDRLH